MQVEFIPKRLRGKLIEQGVTMDQLAGTLGISRYSLSKRMNRKVEFSLGEIHEIMNALHLSYPEMEFIFFAPKV